MYERVTATRHVLRQTALVLLPAWALLLLTFVIPPLNSTHAPYVGLAGWIGVAAYGVAESGGGWGVPVLGVLMLVVLVSRKGLSARQRSAEAGVIFVVLTVVLGGSSYLNEHTLKPWLGVHRPNIEQLAHTPADAPPHSTALGRTADAFYALPDKAARSALLRALSTADGFEGVALHRLVRDHWIDHTGFSFPSGHAHSAMLFAAFFLALGLSVLYGWRRRMCYLVVPWAVLVCFSRPVLRVHTPTDIAVGALQGMALGVAAFLLVRALAQRAPRADASNG